MWLVNKKTNEKGWFILQVYQQEPCSLLVFVKNGSSWKTKQWMSTDTNILAKNYDEEIKHDYEMIQSGFLLGFTKEQLNMSKCYQCVS